MKTELDVWYEAWDRAGSEGLDTWFELAGSSEDGGGKRDRFKTPDGDSDDEVGVSGSVKRLSLR